MDRETNRPLVHSEDIRSCDSCVFSDPTFHVALYVCHRHLVHPGMFLGIHCRHAAASAMWYGQRISVWSTFKTRPDPDRMARSWRSAISRRGCATQHVHAQADYEFVPECTQVLKFQARFNCSECVLVQIPMLFYMVQSDPCSEWEQQVPSCMPSCW